jgi:hypothetical protein
VPTPTPERSYEDKKPGQQLYGAIEFCTSTETLFAKIESGHYDWLGVRETKGRVTYVLGRPRVGRLEGIASGIAKHAETGRHRVEVLVPHRTHRVPSESWWSTAEEARAEYDRLRVALMGGDGSGLFRVSLFIDGVRVEQQVVVRALPNVL